jgi:hypothetical protein
MTHCPTRLGTAFWSASAENPKTNTSAPIRPSGVSAGSSREEMPVSASQEITEALYPVTSFRAALSQYSSAAVIIKLTKCIGNASANVS